MNWYVVNVLVGKEKKIRKILKGRIKKAGVQSSFGDIYIPSEKIKKESRGKKREVNQRIFPGYILIQMEMTKKLWHLVKNTHGVGGFMGPNKEPIPLDEDQVSKIKNDSEERKNTLQQRQDFKIGEKVRIIEGPFASFNGVVDNVMNEKNKLRVMVSIFGRKTPVELEYNQVKKIKK